MKYRPTNTVIGAIPRLSVPAALLLACGAVHGAAPPTPRHAAAAPAMHAEPRVSAAGMRAPGTALVNPFAGDAAVAKAGATLFASMNCDGCHGGDAAGWVGPNLGDGRWRFGGSDTDVFDSIFYGRPKGMPAFGGVLGTRGVWVLITYLRSLPKPADVPTESWPDR